MNCPNCHGSHIQLAYGHKLNQCLSCFWAFDNDSAEMDSKEVTQ